MKPTRVPAHVTVLCLVLAHNYVYLCFKNERLSLCVIVEVLKLHCEAIFKTIKVTCETKKYDHARTRTWNLLIRSQAPYPLGHAAGTLGNDNNHLQLNRGAHS